MPGDSTFLQNVGVKNYAMLHPRRWYSPKLLFLYAIIIPALFTKTPLHTTDLVLIAYVLRGKALFRIYLLVLKNDLNMNTMHYYMDNSMF
jgi:hypothetical protein